MPGIGETLREERLSRGLTHEYVSQIIKIRPEFLAALEEENLSALPGNFYAKNFLRRYADFLDLDSSSLVQRFVQMENGGGEAPPLIVQPANRAPVARRHWRPNFGVAAAFAVLAIVGLALAYRAFLAPPSRSGNTVASTVPTPSSIAVAVLPSPTTQPQVAAPTERRAAETPTEVSIARAPTATTPPEPTSTPKPAVKRNTPVRNTAARATATPTPTSTPTRRPTKTPTPRPTRTPTPTPTSTPTPRPTRTPTPEPTMTPRPTNTPAAPTTGEVVGTVRTNTPATVTVKSDGRTVFSGTISPGQTQTFGANANLYVFSTSAQNVLVSVNGCALRTLDSYGCPGCTTAYYNFPRTYFRCS